MLCASLVQLKVAVDVKNVHVVVFHCLLMNI